MPVQRNIAIQTVGTVAWDGSTSRAYDIRRFTHFAWSFEVATDIATDAVFNIEWANPSEADPCVPDNNWNPVPEIADCSGEAEPGPQASVTIPAGTAAGAICGGTIPCRPGAFVRLSASSGDTANVLAVMLRQGPKMG